MSTVVVTGAAGQTGLVVTRACTARGLAVTALVRRESQRSVALEAGAAPAVAHQCGVRRFVLHSVLAPYLPAMPHHLRKAESERVLRASELDWTILQPASYSQNIQLDSMRRAGVLTVPYRATAPFTPVDLDDVAEVAALVLTEPDYHDASYE